MNKIISLKDLDITGQKFNRLTAIKYINGEDYSKIRWLFKCDCGTEKEILLYSVKRQSTKSCGCLYKERNNYNIPINASKHPLYQKWHSMNYRCFNENCPHYNDYGGRGITVCDEWANHKNGFINFYNWSLNNGWQEGLEIDRIDVNHDYCAENCRYVTQKINSNNKRNSISRIKKINLLIFDLDGTIIELKELHKNAFLLAIKEITGVELAEDFHDKYLEALPTKVKLKTLFADSILCEKIHNSKQTKTLSLLQNYPFDKDLYLTLKELKNLGYIIWVASNSLRKTVILAIDRLKINEFLDGIIGNDEVTNSKPNPEMYFKIISKYNLSEKNTLVIEDSEIGRQAIEASGCHGLMVKDRSEVTLKNILNRIEEIEHS